MYTKQKIRSQSDQNTPLNSNHGQLFLSLFNKQSTKYTHITSNNNYYSRHWYTNGTWNTLKRKFSSILHFVYYIDSKRWRYLPILGIIFVIFLIINGIPSKENVQQQTGLVYYADKRIYMPVKYLGINPNITSELPQGITIYHVSKEFDFATEGYPGKIVTGLVKAQAANTSLNVNIIIPYYSFLKKKYQATKYVQLGIKIRDADGQWKYARFLTSKFELKTSSNGNINVFMIGSTKNLPPFNQAFKINVADKLYTPKNKFSLEWRDLYFCKAAAEFITYRNTMIDTPLFSKRDSRGVDVVHIHGTTNAMVIEFLKNTQKNFKGKDPSIVYTLHNYYDDHLHSYDLKDVDKFMDVKSMDQFGYENSQYIRDNRLFVSSLAVDKSQMVTFMSEETAREMVEGPLDFDFKELVLPNIINKASIGRWIGISYGFDVTEPNPFKNRILEESNAIFPGNLYTLDPSDIYDNAVNISSKDLIVVSKLNAKKYLIQEGLLSEEDLERPLVLFEGKFEVTGFQFFVEAASTLATLNAKFVIMGQRNNYPSLKLKKMIENYSDHLIIIYEPEAREQWDVHLYAAADIQYVPDLSEDFGLVAAEGLLFGTPVVSSDIYIGDLSEILINKTIETTNYYNSYLFELDEEFIDSSVIGLKSALTDAVYDWRKMSMNLVERELFVRGLIKDALKLDWRRIGGPIEQYKKVYKMAILQITDTLEIDELWH
ncbi:15741_t:CDS:2 [Dentiscutata erythropus]|uniref:15741_t:CDS:1 n=1 Tax=Dentiscutata erythropus TaxID=1348616 RepID=A0A9N9CK82_9GLOM|nr:15741_t:CDS:2 [Dentiscutata erythropus]